MRAFVIEDDPRNIESACSVLEHIAGRPLKRLLFWDQDPNLRRRDYMYHHDDWILIATEEQETRYMITDLEPQEIRNGMLLPSFVRLEGERKRVWSKELLGVERDEVEIQQLCPDILLCDLFIPGMGQNPQLAPLGLRFLLDATLACSPKQAVLLSNTTTHGYAETGDNLLPLGVHMINGTRVVVARQRDLEPKNWAIHLV